MKALISGLLFMFLSASFAQSFDRYSIQDLDSIKKAAISNSDFSLAESVKNEMINRSALMQRKDSLQAELKTLISKENFSEAENVHKLIQKFNRLDSLRVQLKAATQSENFSLAANIKNEIKDIELFLQNKTNQNHIPEIVVQTISRVDTLYYNSNWLGVNSFDECSFYRVLNLDSENKIINPVIDYYKSGEIEGKGFAGSVDPNDDSKSAWIGLVEVYDKYGKVTFRRDFSAVCNTIFVEGREIKFYKHNNIILAVNAEISKQYGKYYTVSLYLANYGDDQFLFDPLEISVELKRSNELYPLEVIPCEEYMKKVSNRQAWNAALVSWYEASMASNAGYSTTAYNNNTSGYVISRNGGVYGTVSTSGVAASYNGADAYHAQQVARQNATEFNAAQNEIRQAINEEYLKKNTIFGQTSISGVFNIKGTTSFCVVTSPYSHGKTV
ncbi:MAG: hypothetical protein AB7V36_13090 [Bacteroidales bacterium]